MDDLSTSSFDSDQGDPERYTLMELLGRGGSSEVYRAVDQRLDRVVAIKLLAPELHLDKDHTARFETEIRAMSRLSSHPAIVTIFDAGTLSSGTPYIAMEYLPRGSLLDRMNADGPVDTVELCRLSMPLLDAIAYAHSLGIVHADIKPSNIFLSAFGTALLGDFGVASFLNTLDEEVSVAFTPLFAPPEVFQLAALHPSRDVYSFGVTLLVLAGGRMPRLGGTISELAQKAGSGERLDTSALESDGLRAIVDKCIDPIPERRPAVSWVQSELAALAQISFTPAAVLDEPITVVPVGPQKRKVDAPSGLTGADEGGSAVIPEKSSSVGSDSNTSMSAGAAPAGSAANGARLSARGAHPRVEGFTVHRASKRPSSSSGQERRVRRLSPQSSFPTVLGEVKEDLRSFVGLRRRLRSLESPVLLWFERRRIRRSLRQSRQSGHGRRDRARRKHFPANERAGDLLAVYALTDRPTPVDLLGVKPLVVGLARVLDDPATSLPISVGVTGRWGSGKSSTLLQLGEELRTASAYRSWRVVQIGLWRQTGRERIWSVICREAREQLFDQGPHRFARCRFRAQVWLERKNRVSLAIALMVIAGLGVSMMALEGQQAKAYELPVSVAVAAALVVSTLSSVGERLLGSARRLLAWVGERPPDYTSSLGLTYAAQRDIDALFRVARRSNLSILMILDDLDRCAPDRVVETLSAISEITSARDEWPVAFALGIDGDMVTSSLEAEYEKTLEALRARRPESHEDFGAQYLEKVLQLSVSVDRQLHELGPLIAPVASRLPDSEAVALVQEYQRILNGFTIVNPGDVADVRNRHIAATGDLGTVTVRAVREAMRLERARVLSRKSPAVQAAETMILRAARMTPRRAKRFDSLLRLQLHVANTSPGCSLAFTDSEVLATAKWVCVSMMWPRLLRVFETEIGLLGEIEHYAQEGRGYDKFQARLQQSECIGLISPTEIRRLWDVLALGGEPSRVSILPIDSFLRVI